VVIAEATDFAGARSLGFDLPDATPHRRMPIWAS
jgi:hypothetical protein